MRCARIEFHSPLAEPIRHFVMHKRALNRRFDTEERALCLLDRYLVVQGINDLASVTPVVIDAWHGARDRAHAVTITSSEWRDDSSTGWSIRKCLIIRRCGSGHVVRRHDESRTCSICRTPVDSSMSPPRLRTTIRRGSAGRPT